MLKFRTEAEFEKWLRALSPAQSRRIAPARPRPAGRPVPAPGPARARAAGRRSGAGAKRAVAWFFVTVVGLSTWGLSLCVFGLVARTYP